jgi:uncharacterized Zn finger protein
MIDFRGRANYQEAAVALRNARRLYDVLGDQPSWIVKIARIRDENRRLRVLQEELDRAGL